jgi:tetratricopeptide (TPR) repeat protein
MLARFWKIDAEHIAVADAICYDGTLDHKERDWAADAGFIVREFTVTWDALTALIDRGIPFTLTTIEATSAHLQALVGYDARRRTLLIRDPSTRYVVEALADPFLTDYAPFGPRGMLMIPSARAALLDDLHLPEATERDQLHALRRALAKHDRVSAAAALDILTRQSPDSSITLMARRNLAYYDSDFVLAAATSATWCERFPQQQTIRLMHLDDLPEQAKVERQTQLEELAVKSTSNPIFAIRLAGLLWVDQRHQLRAEDLLRRALRRRGVDAAAMRMLAGIYWDRRELERATAIYRLCAGLEIADEDHAQSYFRACRMLRRTDEALAFLQQRAEWAAKRSPHPTRTLFWALDQLDRTDEGFLVIEDVLARHGDDGYLLRFLAREHAQVGRHDVAGALLQRAEGRVRRIDWLSASADLADRRGERAQAIALWETVLAQDPLFMEAHRCLARLREEESGRAAAIVHVRAAAERFPHHRQLHVLLVQWLREDGPIAVEPAIRHLTESYPGDGWAQRELAKCLLQQRRLDEASIANRAAEQIDGVTALNENLRGELLLARGDLAGAQTAWRAAIHLDADDTDAIDRLMETCGDAVGREQQLLHVQSELERQVTFGDGIESFRSHAHGVLPAETVQRTLQSAHAARPDLWQVWSSLITHYLALDHLDEAEKLANEMCERFPLLPRSWLDRAKVANARNRTDAEQAALEQALQISPSWSVAARRLADLHLQQDALEQAQAVLQRAIAHDPLQSVNHTMLARLHLRRNDSINAIACLERAVALDPGHDQAWNMLRKESEERAIILARAQTTERSHEARAWFRLAEMLNDDSTRDERLAALDRALVLNPRFIAASTLKADLLAQAGRIDEALACCEAEIWQGHPPADLRRRAAQIETRHARRDAALVRLRSLVADEPQDGDSWRDLAGLAQEAGHHTEAIAAAEKLTRLQPRRAVAWGYLADARSSAGDQASAKAAYIRAVELDSTYSFATNRLFDLHLADKELAQAQTVLNHLQRHDGGGWTLVRAVKLAVEKKDQSAACTALENLCLEKNHDSDAVDGAVKVMSDGGMKGALPALFNHVIEMPAAERRTFYHWARTWVPQQSPRVCAERIESLPSERAIIRTSFSYVNWMGEEAPLAHMRAYIQRRRDFLRAHDECWGSVGYALRNKCAYREAFAWCADWRERQGLESWVLLNFADACRKLGHWQEALAAHQRADAMPRDQYFAKHALWLATEAVLTGDIERADRFLPLAETDEQLSKAVLEIAQIARRYLQPEASPWKAACDLMRLIRTYRATFAVADHNELRHLITRLATLMGQRSHGLWRVWGGMTRWRASEYKLW